MGSGTGILCCTERPKGRKGPQGTFTTIASKIAMRGWEQALHSPSEQNKDTWQKFAERFTLKERRNQKKKPNLTLPEILKVGSKEQ